MSTTTSDAYSDGSEPEETSGRLAEISCDADGEQLGVALFLTAEELLLLGVDPDVNAVVVSVRNGRIHVQPVDEVDDE